MYGVRKVEVHTRRVFSSLHEYDRASNGIPTSEAEERGLLEQILSLILLFRLRGSYLTALCLSDGRVTELKSLGSTGATAAPVLIAGRE